jgi:hypothetical protein
MDHERPLVKRNLAIFAVTILLLAAGAEALLRALAARDRERIRASMDERELCTEASPNPSLLYTYTPGKCGANSQGYRDVEHTFEKPDSVFRLVIIGDSVAEGRDVDAKDAFGRVLENELNARNDLRHTYEVVLLARIGYSTSQEMVLLEQEAFRYHPDLIVWSYCLNDPANPVYHNANGDLGRYYYHARSQLLALAETAAFRAKQKWRGRGCPSEFHAFVHCAFWPEVEANLARIGDDCRRERVPVVFVIHPVFEKDATFENYSLRDVHSRLVKAALAQGFDIVDLRYVFEDYPPGVLKLDNPRYYDPWHMSVLGHQVTATTLASHIP